MCLGAIYWARLRTVYYAATRDDAAGAGFSDAAIYHELSLPPETRSLRFVKKDATASVAVMRAWQADTGGQPY